MTMRSVLSARKLVTPEMDAEIKRLYLDEKASISAISVRTSLGRATIHVSLRRQSIELRHTPQSRNPRKYGVRSLKFDASQLDQIVCDWRTTKSLEKLAAKWLCDPSAVKNALIIRGAYDGRQGKSRSEVVTVVSVNPYTSCYILSNDARVIRPYEKFKYQVGDIYPLKFSHG
jgi:hypothetical protein